LIPFPISFLAILIGTLIPAYLGLFGAVSLGGYRPQYLAAFSIGVFLWFFSDTIGDSSYLGVNQGLAGGASHLALIILFVIAPIVLFMAEGMASKQTSASAASLPQSLLVPVLVTVALSLHGLGEGMGYGGAASLPSNSSLLDTFGGYAPAASYILHKVLEPVAIGACYLGSFLSHEANRRQRFRWGDLASLGVIFVLPTLVGTAVGYYLPFDSTYLFALGAGASVYVLLKLIQVIIGPPSPFVSRGESLKVVLLALLGFVLIYSAAILH
jgi:hypothetical protein